MLKERLRLLPNIFKPADQQIKDISDLLASFGLEGQKHVNQVQNLNEATDEILKIIRESEDNNQSPLGHIFCDFDGVIRPRLVMRNFSLKEKKLTVRALKSLIKNVHSFTLWSSRIVVNTDNHQGIAAFLTNHLIEGNNALSRFPFFTNRSLRRLFNYLQDINPNCDIEFNIGPEKLTGQDPFIEKALNILNQGQSLFIISSSFVDRMRIKKLVELCQQNNSNLLNHLYYFDTGRMIY